MVLEAVSCKHCGQTQHLKRYGTTRAGTQRYRCYDCGWTFVQTYTHKARDPSVKEQITARRPGQMVLNGAGVRDTARILGVNRNTVSAQFRACWEIMFGLRAQSVAA